MSLAKVTFIKSVKVCRYRLCSCVAACYIKCVCAVCCAEFHSVQRSTFTSLVNVTLARLICKLPDDGQRPKHVGAILTLWRRNYLLNFSTLCI